ncbi:MAG: hypothetical protein AB8B87_12635 [Granulosicoccus sp.]
MVSKRKIGTLYLVALWVLISTLAWPAYVLCSTLLAFHGAEGWQLDAWHQLPGSIIIQQFLTGYQASLIVTIPLGFLAVVDYLLLSRYKATWLVGGILLPLAGIVVAFGLYNQPYAALPTLLATGVLLAVVHRLLDAVAGRNSREWLR